MLRKALQRIAAVMLLTALAACAQCGEEAPAEAPSPTDELPAGAEAVTDALARALPADTPAVVFLRSWSDVFDGYAGARPRLERVTGDLGFVETDVRNTLSIDIRRAESLDAIGVSSRGGAAAASVADTGVIVLVLSDADRFVAHITEILQKQPFGLDGEPELVDVAGASLTIFRRAGRDRAEASLAVHGPLAYLFPSPPEDGGRAALNVLLAVDGASLADDAVFQSRMATAPDMPWWVRTSGTATGEQLGALAESLGLAPEALERPLSLAGDGIGGFELDDTGLRAHWRQTPEPEVLTAVREATEQATPPPFENLMTDDVFALLRVTLSLEQIVERATAENAGAWAEPVLDQITAIDAQFGEGFVAGLLPALGRHVFVMTTRARLITLSRAMNSNAPGEWFNGLGVVIALDVRQREAVESALRAAVASFGERAALFEDNGVTVIEFTDAEADIGSVVLTNDVLMLVPGRQRSEYLAQLRTGDGASMANLESLGGAPLVRDASVQGLFVDVQQVVTGPIGSVALARLPAEVRSGLGQFDRAVLDMRVDGDAIVSSATLQFSPPPADTP